MLHFEVGSSGKEAKELRYLLGGGGKVYGDSERTGEGGGDSRNPGSLGFPVSQVAGASKVVNGELSLHPQSALGKRGMKMVLYFWIIRKLDSGYLSEVGVLREDLRARNGEEPFPA